MNFDSFVSEMNKVSAGRTKFAEVDLNITKNTVLDSNRSIGNCKHCSL